MATTNVSINSAGWNLVRTGDGKEIQIELVGGGKRGELGYGSAAPSNSVVGHDIRSQRPVPLKPPAGMNTYYRGLVGDLLVLTVVE